MRLRIMPALLAAAALVAGATAGVAAPRPAAAGSSQYHDPCEGGATDIRGLHATDPDQGTVVFRFDLCRPTEPADLAPLRIDVHPLIAGSSDHSETPTRWVRLTPSGGAWTCEVRGPGPSGPATVAGCSAQAQPAAVPTSVTADVPATALRDPADGLDMSSLTLRACTGDADCGPAYEATPAGGARLEDPGPYDPAIDYLPEPRHFQVSWPLRCEGSGDRVLRAAALPDDPMLAASDDDAGQWSLRRIGAERAWATTRGDPDVLAAVLDSGIDGQHPDLARRSVAARDFVPVRSAQGLDRTLPTDVDSDLGGHGSFVASQIAASTDDGFGMAGIGWQTRLLVARVLDAEGCASDTTVADAMDWAVSNGAHAINISLGGTGTSPLLGAAGERARRAGVVSVAAAGNTGTGGGAQYPASHPEFVSVGATAFRDGDDPAEDRVAGYSSRNEAVELTAPGGDGTGPDDIGVLGACRRTTPGMFSHCRRAGTSFAAALVTGAVALVRAVDPDRTVAGIRDLLADTARDLRTPGRDPETGFGRIDVGAAVSLLASREQTLRRVAPGPSPRSAATALSQEVFRPDGATAAVLARDDVFADALAGAPLAGSAGPILLTGGAGLDPAVAEELRRVLPQQAPVFLLGGTAALGPEVEAAVRDLGYADVRRLAGADRVETAARVARAVGSDGHALIASAADWPDAVSGGAYAAATGIPLLLAWPDGVTGAGTLHAALRDLDVTAPVLLGGTAALPAAVADGVAQAVDGPVTRVAGRTRFETAVAVTTDLWGRTSGRAGDRYVLAHGERADGWAYALAATPVAAVREAPLLLVTDDLASSQPSGLLRGLGYRLGRPADGIFVGPDPTGTSAQPDGFTTQRLRELLGG